MTPSSDDGCRFARGHDADRSDWSIPKVPQDFHLACKDTSMVTRQYELLDHGTLTHLQVNENIDTLKSKSHSYDLEWHSMRKEGPREPEGTKNGFPWKNN